MLPILPNTGKIPHLRACDHVTTVSSWKIAAVSQLMTRGAQTTYPSIARLVLTSHMPPAAGLEFDIFVFVRWRWLVRGCDALLLVDLGDALL